MLTALDELLDVGLDEDSLYVEDGLAFWINFLEFCQCYIKFFVKTT